jgi:hypothetical protein
MTDAAESWGEPRRQEIVDPSADEPIDLDSVSTDILRKWARATDGARSTEWSAWTREMLIAFFRNDTSRIPKERP